MPAVAARLASGTKLGPYEVRGFVGAGGMGSVYRAHDPRLGRDVAVKVLPDAMRAEPSWQARFEREARAAAAINHPNVMALYDVGVHEDVPYLVCELLEGETLRAKLEHGPLSGARALEWAQQIARGLAAAHERGLVHRDLKPSNLFVTRDGVVKILDFGLAKAAPVATGDTLPAEGAVPTPTELTGSGAVVGTLGYMAPEQVLGRPADARSDLFAFGVVLHEMLAGRAPFAGDTGPEIALAILKSDPPPLPAGAPAGAERLVLHCLEKDPGARFQTARDLVFALDTLGVPPSTLPRPGPRRRLPMLALAVAVLAVGAAVDRWLLPAPPASQAAAAQPTFERITFGRNSSATARFLSDGRSFVFDAWIADEPAGVFLGRIGKPEATPLLPGVLLLAVSRSDELAVLRSARRLTYPMFEGTLARVDVTGGAPRDVAEHVVWADWSPEGHGLALVRNDGGRQVLEYQGKGLFETTHGIGWIRIAPDGQRIAFVELVQPGDDRGRIAVVDLDGRVRRLTPEYGTVGTIAWSPDGRELYFSAGAAIARSVHLMTLDGVERSVLSGPDALDVEEVTSDRRLLVLRSAPNVYHFAHVAGATGETEVSASEYDTLNELSPDGSLVALTAIGGGVVGEYRVYLKPTDGRPATLLGEGAGAKFSPDGKWVVVGSIIDRARLTILPVGPGSARVLPAGSLTDRWSPGFAGPDRIVFVGIEPGARSRLYVQDVAGGAPRPFSPEGFDLNHSASFVSPDGLTVLALDATKKTVLLSIADGTQRDVPGLGPSESPIQWTEDGQALYVFAIEKGVEHIDLLDVATGRRSRWRELGAGGVGGDPWRWRQVPTVSRNGRAWVSHFVVGQSDLHLVTLPGR